MTSSNYSSVPGVVKYGGFWRRFWALMLDSLICSIGLGALSILLKLTGVVHFTEGGTGPVWYNILMSCGFVLYTVFFWVNSGATPGKSALGLKVVSLETGQSPTIGQALLRYLGYYISMLVFMLGYLWAGFDPRKQAWHDKIASTVVVRTED